MALTIIDPTNSANVDREGEYKRIGDTKPGWSSSGDATPHSIASTQGGTGTLSFNASQALGEGDLLVARDVMIDGILGKFQSVGVQGENVSLTMDTVLSRLNTRRTAQSWATNFVGGDIPFPLGTTVTVAGVPRSLGGRSFSIAGSDYDDGYVYFYGESRDTSGYFPVVMRFTQAGAFDSAWSPSGGHSKDLSGSAQYGFAIDKVNNFIYLMPSVSTAGGWIKKYTMTGTYVSEFQPGATSGFAVANAHLTVDGGGNIYVSGGPSGNHVQKFNSSYVYVSGMGTTGTLGDYAFNGAPTQLAFDGLNILAANFNNKVLRAYNTSLVFVKTIDQWVMGSGDSPVSLTVDRTYGIVYVVTSNINGYTLRSYSSSSPSYLARKVRPLGQTGAGAGVVADGMGRVYYQNLVTDPTDAFTFRPDFRLLFDRDGPAKLSLMVHYYLCLALGASEFEYRFNATDPTVIFGGWNDNVWEMLKQLGAAKSIQYKAGVSPLPNGAYRASIEIVTTLDSNVTDLDQTVAGSLQISVSMQNAVRTYEIVNQNSSTAPFGDATVVYSAYVDGQGFSIDVDKTAFTQVTVPHSLISVNADPPEMSTWNNLNPGYQVYDSTGLKLPVGLFASYGGKVQAFLLDANTISFVINGPFSAIPGYTGPFDFADGAGNGRLNVGGSGVLLNPQNVTMYTGADESYVTDDNGPRIDSPFIENITQVYDRGTWASLDLSGPRIELSFELGPGEGGLYSIGERIKYNHQIWRIMSVQAGAYTTQVVATPYTTVGDKDDAWAGQTVAQYDAFWAGYRVYDSKVRPLWRTRP